MGSFGDWVLLKEGSNKKRAPQPVQPKKAQTNKITIRKPKDRLPGGRKNTTFQGTQERMPKGEQERKAIKEFD